MRTFYFIFFCSYIDTTLLDSELGGLHGFKPSMMPAMHQAV